MGWKRALRSYFTFNRRERRGVIALVAILFALIMGQLWLRYAPQDAEDLAALDPATIFESNPFPAKEEDDVAPVEWRSFDPNTVTKQELLGLGLEPGIAQRLINYREKGGQFRSTNDLLKLYGMDSLWVMEAAAFLVFPEGEDERAAPVKEKRDKKDQQQRKVDLNRADTNDLKSIRGIGSYYAREVVKLRERLGGYLSFDQLLDVYNMRDDAITILSENTYIDPSAVKRININTCTVEPLGRHPYLSWKQAKVIVSYRQQHGPYQRTEDITKTKVVSDSVYRKLAPYLSIE